MNYIILKEFLSKRDCNTIIANTNFFNIPQNLGLLDKDDKTNIWYKSIRSPGLEYRYQNDVTTNSISKGIKQELTNISGIDFSGGINDICLPLCKYNNGGIIKAHRDIDKVSNLNKAIEYVVVCMLTQVAKDFETLNEEDNLFINFNPLKVSEDGKLVMEDYPGYGQTQHTIRFFPNLNKGDIIIFRNDNSIHGVEPIIVKEGQIGRITCGFRSK